MIGPFLASQWGALAHGEKIKCRYIVIPRAETVGFTFSKSARATWQGQPVLIIKMAATSPFIAALVDPLFFTVEERPPHHILQYVGRTTPKIRAAGNTWKDLMPRRSLTGKPRGEWPRRTSNVQRRTSNLEPAPPPLRFNVQRSMFEVRRASADEPLAQPRMPFLCQYTTPSSGEIRVDIDFSRLYFQPMTYWNTSNMRPITG